MTAARALHQAGAGELLAAYRTRALSPVEVVRALLDRIDRWEPHLHATWALDADGALAQARASEARWLRGRPCGALDGVPVTVKENIRSKGLPVPVGTAATELVPAADDAPPMARLREAGALLLGKTTMPDYGMLSSGLSSFHALTRNPWDLELNPGGSSSGAAAAAAAGYAPLHVGTDIGGSIRLPAGWCGIVGFKPSLGRIPIDPPYAGRVAGPMTRCIEDAARMMAVLAQPDWRDATSLPPQAIDWLALQCDRAQVRRLRIGLLLDAGAGMPVEPEISACVEAAASALEREGARVDAMEPFIDRPMMEGLNDFWRLRTLLDLDELPAERRAKVLPYIAQWAEGARGLSGERVFRGYTQIAVMRDAAVRACQPFDFVLSPVSPVGTFPACWASPLQDPQRPFEHIAFTVPYNMSEQPAISVNGGYNAAGMPIGLQIAGRRHDDLGVLRAAWLWEKLRGVQRPWPDPA